MLKGQPRMSTGGKYYVEIPPDAYDKRIADIFYERPRCIVFLSEKRLIVGVGNLSAQLIDPYQGIVLADAASIAAVKASLQKNPPPKAKPVLVISAIPHDAAAPFATALRRDFTVVETRLFTAHSPRTVTQVRDSIPHVAILVTIDAGPKCRVVGRQCGSLS